MIYKNIELRTSFLTDQNLIQVCDIVSKYPPFFNYSFRLMLVKLFDQLVNTKAFNGSSSQFKPTIARGMARRQRQRTKNRIKKQKHRHHRPEHLHRAD